MMLNTNRFIPQVYGKERMMQVFTKLFDIIANSCKHDIDNLGNVYDAYKCPETLLPFLAKTLNYQYNYNDTVTANRRTIAVFTEMERHRGSEKGLKIATALSLTSMNISENSNEIEILNTQQYLQALKDIYVTYDPEEALITIKYPNCYTLVRYLLDYVRPVGMLLVLESVVPHNINSDVMLLLANIASQVHEYNPETETKVNHSFVNFSATVDEKWLEQFNVENENDVELDFNS